MLSKQFLTKDIINLCAKYVIVAREHLKKDNNEKAGSLLKLLYNNLQNVMSEQEQVAYPEQINGKKIDMLDPIVKKLQNPAQHKIFIANISQGYIKTIRDKIKDYKENKLKCDGNFNSRKLMHERKNIRLKNRNNNAETFFDDPLSGKLKKRGCTDERVDNAKEAINWLQQDLKEIVNSGLNFLHYAYNDSLKDDLNKKYADLCTKFSELQDIVYDVLHGKSVDSKHYQQLGREVLGSTEYLCKIYERIVNDILKSKPSHAVQNASVEQGLAQVAVAQL